MMSWAPGTGVVVLLPTMLAAQLPHGGGESQHQSVALLQQPDVLPGHLLTPEQETVETYLLSDQ